MKYAVVTFGCRVNQADSLRIEGDLLARGAEPSSPDQADLVIVNSCSVTASADQGTRQTVRRIARNNPAVQIVVTGCYATRCGDEVAALPNVVHVSPNAEKDELIQLLAGSPRLATAGQFGHGEGEDACGRRLEPGAAGRTALTLRVQTGCEERCSYCIIPQTRGASRSRPLADITGDITNAIAAGYREIAISGVHLGAYGRDLDGRTTLETLVHRLAAWPDEVLFRISSLEPMDCTPAIVESVAQSPRLAPHFHLPLQHGSDAILSAMSRPYTGAAYRRLIETIHERLPHAAIGSDIMVGFPGETDRHHAESQSLLELLPLTHLHVFPYSDRPGTVAASLPDKVDGRAVRDRSREIREISRVMALRFRQSQAGTVRRALVVDDGTSAVTDNYLKVRLDRPSRRNEWVEVLIETGEPMCGRILSEAAAPSAAPPISSVLPRQ